MMENQISALNKEREVAKLEAEADKVTHLLKAESSRFIYIFFRYKVSIVGMFTYRP